MRVCSRFPRGARGKREHMSLGQLESFHSQ